MSNESVTPVRTTSPRELLSIALGGKRARSTAERLAALQALRARLDEEEQHLAFAMRAGGATWADVGDTWGITGQAAQQRFNAAALLDQLDAALGREPRS